MCGGAKVLSRLPRACRRFHIETSQNLKFSKKKKKENRTLDDASGVSARHLPRSLGDSGKCRCTSLLGLVLGSGGVAQVSPATHPDLDSFGTARPVKVAGTHLSPHPLPSLVLPPPQASPNATVAEQSVWPSSARLEGGARYGGEDRPRKASVDPPPFPST